MPAPQYLAGKDATANFGGEMAVMDGSYDRECNFDEMTNLKKRGYYSSVPTDRKWSGSLDCAYEGDSPPTFDEGSFIEAASISVPGGETVQGDVYIDKINMKSVTAKGGVKYSFTFHSEGKYIVTR